MDLRREGEFAFGSAVFACGGLFLALAAGRLTAPVGGSRVEAVAMVAADTAVPVAPLVPARPKGSARAETARLLRPAAFRERQVALRATPLAPKSKPPRARAPQHALPRSSDRSQASMSSHVARIVVAAQAAKPAAEVRFDKAHVPPRNSARAALRPPPPHAIARRSAMQTQRIVIVHNAAKPRHGNQIARNAAKRQHRYGIAFVRIRPKAERTPEPPIGYDDHPALLRTEASIDATAAPVQVELETTHLAR